MRPKKREYDSGPAVIHFNLFYRAPYTITLSLGGSVLYSSDDTCCFLMNSQFLCEIEFF